ncbi:cytochrome P450 [Mycena albidolilacea]|uniref:Cytochrome P450 n=1 Tax=Mycena albidolilacea TaxID=1033008 RepID=A0AAD6YZS2_9AGAR|nr:cytochrome P450 [Mycena albidolilacea]
MNSRMISEILLPIAGTLLFYVSYHITHFIYRRWTSSLRHVAGPQSSSWMFGNFKEIRGDPQLTDRWREEFGPTFKFKWLFSTSELYTSDIKALTHIVNNGAIYRRAPSFRSITAMLLGKGILSVDLDQHKHQRRMLNPAFSVTQIRLVTEIFVEKAVQLRDIWSRKIALGEKDSEQVDVLSGLRCMTLDVIGKAGFNYDFDALEEANGRPSELNEAFTELLYSPRASRYAFARLVQSMIPVLRSLPAPWRAPRNARTKMDGIANQIVMESKANTKLEGLAAKRDLLSVLVKANMSPSLPESQRLTHAEVIAQIPTFFVAGHETTSTATAWALHALSQHTAVQIKLRNELLTLSTDNPTMEELNSLPYLETVVREIMRFHAPAVFTRRMAMEDDIVPLSKPYIDKAGKSHNSLLIPKGQMIHIPILAVNTDTEIWGEDAREFKPERWENLPDAVSLVPGVWANLLTFFAGTTNCIGFRVKALLFTLIRAFEFEAAVPKGGIRPKMSGVSGILQTPVVLGEEEKGSTLPLIVRPYIAQ